MSQKTSSSSSSPSSPLFRLPLEIRQQIYTYLLRPANCKNFPSPSSTTTTSTNDSSASDSSLPSQDDPSDLPPSPASPTSNHLLTGPNYTYPIPLFLLSRQIHTETLPLFRSLNRFVKISTPWSEAIRHINSEGGVGVVAIGSQATDFQNFHLRVLISTAMVPGMGTTDPENYDMITEMGELEGFVRTWGFSHLNSARHLNPHLVLRVDLKEPYPRQSTGQAAKQKGLDVALQTRLLSPFGKLKDLNQMLFDFHGRPFFEGGDVDEEVKEMVIKEQAIPELTPEERIQRCKELGIEGEVCIGKKEYKQAIDCYLKAFEAVHIYHTESGRKREVHCDSYYAVELRDGDYRGQFGHLVRIMLRISLVARVMDAFIKLQEWEDALFWGRRSISTFKSSLQSQSQENADPEIYPERHVVHATRKVDSMWLIDGYWETFMREAKAMQFAGKPDMGLIFYRTAIAGREVRRKDDEEVRACMDAAEAFRPEDPLVKVEAKAMALRIMARKDDLVECVNSGPG
ncbi:uncharacterized protein KY384_000794 [Bacidia gigantensis]|uniref:uncharacterized protein n=1 Tax=Bacidia gigantensis TaxID=2732470 RepID=UPI001D05AAAB|nr:uncharacterized protein KY384_000794 [Bacidia gigantensis]KAG8526032.1 hypothetical protein KY384_000794 [Bacidia gigantensis]